MVIERVSSAADETVLPLAAGLLLFVPLALLGNALGPVLRYPDAGAAILFAPYAILTAALLAAPRRQWIWYLLAGSVAHFVTHWPQWTLSWVLAADAANVARALTAATALRWLFGRPLRLESIRALTLFIVTAAVVAPAVGATIGAANVVLHGASPTYWRPWSAWFISNALTGLTMLPACAAAFAYAGDLRRVRFEPARVAEAVVLAVVLVATGAIAFSIGVPGAQHLVLPLYTPLPVLMWAALRFGPVGASVALTGVAFMAIWSVDRGTGPFLMTSPDDNVIALQSFVLLTTVPILSLAAIGSARQSVVRLYRALLASMQDQVAVLDARGVVLEVNESWRRFADYGDAPRFQRVGPGDDFVAACRAAADGGDVTAANVLAGLTAVLHRLPPRFEIEYDDGHDARREFYVMSVEALERRDGGAVVTRANVTVRRRAQLEIEEQRREMWHLGRVAVLGQLSGAFAHELHQPLTSILGNAEAARLLIRRRPADLEELSLILADIVADDQRAAEVIHRLRALLKRGDVRLQPIDAGELITDVLGLAGAELITRRVIAIPMVDPDLPPLLGDRVQLQQVLLNLILNACEAMGETAVADRRIFLAATGEVPGHVHLSIRDCGPGIPPALIDRLFEPFMTTKPEGLGLGLSIVRTIVAAHSGRLWAENNPEGGATMHCLIAAGERVALATPRPISVAGGR